MLNVIPLPYKLLGLFLILSGLYWYAYSSGKDAAHTAYEIQAAKDAKIFYARGMAAAQQEVKSVTVYKDKVITIEKRVPVYVNKIKEVLNDKSDIMLSGELSCMYDASLTNGDPDTIHTCGPDGTSGRVVSIEQFTEAVIRNNG